MSRPLQKFSHCTLSSLHACWCLPPLPGCTWIYLAVHGCTWLYLTELSSLPAIWCLPPPERNEKGALGGAHLSKSEYLKGDVSVSKWVKHRRKWECDFVSQNWRHPYSAQRSPAKGPPLFSAQKSWWRTAQMGTERFGMNESTLQRYLFHSDFKTSVTVLYRGPCRSDIWAITTNEKACHKKACKPQKFGCPNVRPNRLPTSKA